MAKTPDDKPASALGDKNSGRLSDKDKRQDKLAAALRENLLKRKAQSRTRRDVAEDVSKPDNQDG